MVRTHSPGSVFWMRSMGPNTPAAFTRICTAPCSFETCFSSFSTKELSLTSPVILVIIDFCVADKPLVSSAERETAITWWPWSARPNAIWRPIPRLAPVTRASFAADIFATYLRSFRDGRLREALLS